jgi:hypothetical protein
LLGGSQVGTIKLPERPQFEVFHKPEELSKHSKKSLLLPSISNFGAIDFCVMPDKLFQVTLSKDHPIKQKALEAVVTNMPTDQKKIYLYFVVSDEIYDGFKEQSYLTERAQQISPILSRVEQWAIKVNIKAALEGKPIDVDAGTSKKRTTKSKERTTKSRVRKA